MTRRLEMFPVGRREIALVRATDDHHGCRHHGARSRLVPPTGGTVTWRTTCIASKCTVRRTRRPKVKWSRENAHVATALVEIMAGRTTVRVESLGRDNVLRFKTGDWVELTSDAREFAGLPGEMRKVTVDDTNKTLTFTRPCRSPISPGVADATKHLRVIRWDQTGIVRKPDGSQLVNLDLTTDGLIELSAANPSFLLEHGVQSNPDGPGRGTAQSGDYWCFAARTADADIERLDLAPPARAVSPLLSSRDHRRPTETFTIAGPCSLRSRSSRLAVARWWCAR